MNEIQAAVLTALPPKRKNTPSGWISFDAPCCIHKGESRDERQRGGILFSPDGGFQYHCFNCNFSTGWTIGNPLSINTKNILKWLGMQDSDLLKINLAILKSPEYENLKNHKLSFELIEKSLPANTLSLSTWLSQNNDEAITQDLNAITEYIDQRGMNLDWYPWHWSLEYRDRLIIPFFYNSKIVGWTGRKINPGKPKYLTQSQPGYVFNIDNQQSWKRQYVIVTEGQFDAIAIDGVAIMHNDPNETQSNRINSLNKEVILVPDHDRSGAKMINAALKYDWAVSLPPWEPYIKDVADAVKYYGRLYTLYSILYYKETNKLKIQLLKKKLESHG